MATHDGVLVLCDLENCRLPKEVPPGELVKQLRQRFIVNKPGCGELGFIIAMTSTVRLQGNQEQLLRYAGANIRRCLGKKGGKNEEAETYLTTEYNYVKHIAKKLANKHIAHLVLLGGDADCFQLIETALADGVSCELLYQPYGVSKVLLQGSSRPSESAMAQSSATPLHATVAPGTQHWNQYRCDVTKEVTAPNLKERLEAEQQEKERRQKEKMEAHLYCYVRVSRDEDFRAQIGKDRWFDLVDFDKLTHSNFRVPKQMKFKDFKNMVEEKLGVPVSKQRYWGWWQRQNKTYRPAKPLKAEEEELCVMDLLQHIATVCMTIYRSKQAMVDLNLFLETPLPDCSAELHKVNPRHDILLFFKYYDPATGSLSYCGHMYAPKQSRMKALHSTLCRAANLPEGTDLECCQEIRFKPTVMIQPINRSSVLHNNAQLEGGDLICFQRAVAPEEEARYIHPRVFGFLTYIRMSSKSAMTQSSAQPSCTTVAPTTSGPADTGECCPLYTMQQQARSHPDLVQYTQDLST
eukprot:jgi/Chrzof1/6437/Cz18g10190.t1